jgi:indolepyruvate ferredoxin oxidoreductase beta subunit
MSGQRVLGATNFLLAGVGGQGILLAADVIALVGMEVGLDVKKSEVHGMAQRGGSVTSHVRWGQHVASPLIATGEVDFFLALERLEALRYAHLLRSGGTLLINDYRIVPVSVSSGDDLYPTDEDEQRAYQGLAGRCTYVPAMRLAQELGQPRVNNVVMLGALSALMGIPEPLWLGVVAARVPQRYVELNQRAFSSGRAFMSAYS